MIYKLVLFIGMLVSLISTDSVQTQPDDYASAPPGYLDSLCQEMQVRWPHNRTINLVFHGHSVPTGYLTKGIVNRWESYPFQSLRLIKGDYPYAVINVITTSIGGEQSEQGAARFDKEVLNHRPDILFIDYGLNDRRIGLDRTEKAWRKMLGLAQKFGTKVVLLTPTPDLKEDIHDDETALARHSQSIRSLAQEYEVALVDSYAFFKALAAKEELKEYMAQNNHIDEKGHALVARAIYSLFAQKDQKDD